MTTRARTAELHAAFMAKTYRSTDRMFLWLMSVQYFATVFAALVLTPTSWSNGVRTVHPHVVASVVLGALVTAPAIAMILLRPGTKATQHTIAVCQALTSSLLIHLSGGRIETHFHIFGSLAFLSFYRDWRVLLPATAVIAGDHFFRGLYFPMSVYGVPSGAEWRFIEHAGWVVFEDVFLVMSCVRGSSEAWTMAERQAALEETNELVEAAVSKRTEELIETELSKTALFESALDGIMMFEPSGRLVEANTAARAMLRLENPVPAGFEFSDIWSESSKESMSEEIGDQSPLVWARGKHVEMTAQNRAGETFPVELAVTRIDGNPCLYAIVLRDLSERSRLQERVLQATKMESLGQLAVGVAHEINTPNQYIGDNLQYVSEAFRGVSDYCKVCQELDDDGLETVRGRLTEASRRGDVPFSLEEIPVALDQALEGVARVASIVRAMKEFAHPGTSDLTATNVNKVAENTIAVTRNEWKYVASLDTDFDLEIPVIQAHPGELGQVLLNLIVNAAHAVKDRFANASLGQITVRTRAEGEDVVIEVEDNGNGIPDSIRAKVFDPFFTTKGVGIGTGQGLSVVHSIVEKHGGDVTFQSEAGKGSCFRIRLPLRGQEDSRAA